MQTTCISYRSLGNTLLYNLSKFHFNRTATDFAVSFKILLRFLRSSLKALKALFSSGRPLSGSKLQLSVSAPLRPLMTCTPRTAVHVAGSIKRVWETSALQTAHGIRPSDADGTEFKSLTSAIIRCSLGTAEKNGQTSVYL